MAPFIRAESLVQLVIGLLVFLEVSLAHDPNSVDLARLGQTLAVGFSDVEGMKG